MEYAKRRSKLVGQLEEPHGFHMFPPKVDKTKIIKSINFGKCFSKVYVTFTPPQEYQHCMAQVVSLSERFLEGMKCLIMYLMPGDAHESLGSCGRLCTAELGVFPRQSH